MLTYKAMYKTSPDGIHAGVLDFPGAITCGKSLEDARLQLAAALVDIAESQLQSGEALPRPTSSLTDADVEEPIHFLRAAVQYSEE